VTVRDATKDSEPTAIITLKLGTRGSELALFQANSVAALLRARAGVACDIVVIRTSGDRLADAALAQIGGKRLFVKEIEDALLAGEIDLAVHSSKDMPAVLPPGLAIGAVLPREDARDAIVLPVGRAGGRDSRSPDAPDADLSLDDVVSSLGNHPRIGTSSVRRTAQLGRLFAGASFLPIRGNLDTRLRKLDSGGYDALVLASAGLIRLDHRARISAGLPVAACIPAPGQGIIAVEVRAADQRVGMHVKLIGDVTSRAALEAERAVVTTLGGGCQMPIGAYAECRDGHLTMMAVVLSLDGRRALHAESRGPVNDAFRVGAAAADDLLAQGAAEILAEVGSAHAAVEGLQP
jgi:hydroxymethylbilane synthase